jgi:hypothetical protein
MSPELNVVASQINRNYHILLKILAMGINCRLTGLPPITGGKHAFDRSLPRVTAMGPLVAFYDTMNKERC